MHRVINAPSARCVMHMINIWRCIKTTSLSDESELSGRPKSRKLMHSVCHKILAPSCLHVLCVAKTDPWKIKEDQGSCSRCKLTLDTRQWHWGGDGLGCCPWGGYLARSSLPCWVGTLLVFLPNAPSCFGLQYDDRFSTGL